MKTFLTGATGFVGSALLSRFVADESDVVCLVRKESNSLPAGVKQMVGDLMSLCEIPDQVRDDGYEVRGDEGLVDSGRRRNDGHQVRGDGIFKDLLSCDVVVHAAARAHIMRDEVSDPLAEYRKVNRDATLMLARLAAEAGVKRFVFVSSVKVNGEMTRPGETFKPDLVGCPTDKYALSKFEAEQGLLKVAKQTGMEVVIVRPPLVYGPNAKGNFASMVKWVKKGVPLPLGSVRNFRSLVALENLVDFIALCADRERSPKAANEVFLISDGVDVSTSDLLRKVAKACGVKSRLLPVPVGLMRFSAKVLGKGAVADRLFGNLQVDSSKTRDLLGWKPVVTMDEALERMFKGKDL
jgi:nucleoside-diphosphate-sugar epimerase